MLQFEAHYDQPKAAAMLATIVDVDVDSVAAAAVVVVLVGAAFAEEAIAMADAAAAVSGDLSQLLSALASWHSQSLPRLAHRETSL